MGENNITDTKNIILEWLNKEKAPFEIDSNSKELIADLCVDQQYEKQNREKFEKEIDKIISELAKKHLESGV
jgi:histidinol-phosphate/aromatic aminotransferase/cobyric acid decarboxylase-like protein